jgi:hypothetical protein
LRNSSNSSQFSKFLCEIAALGSPLILVGMNWYSLFLSSGRTQLNAVSALDTNVKIYFLLPLKGETNFRASVTLIYCVVVMSDLPVFASCISGYGLLQELS